MLHIINKHVNIFFQINVVLLKKHDKILSWLEPDPGAKSVKRKSVNPTSLKRLGAVVSLLFGALPYGN